jgi:hypothetical protein
MTAVTYNLAIPNGPNNPSADQPLMQTNTNSINTLIGVDHVPFNTTTAPTAQGGYHTIIHQPVQGASPTPLAGMTQLYSLSYTPPVTGGGTPGTQLFMTNNGGTIQMTGAHLVANGGFAWCNGLLTEWGVVNTTFPTPTGTVTFQAANPGVSIPFPTACFNVQITMKGTSGTANLVQVTSISPTGFGWQFTGPSSTSYTGFYWFAVGN